MDIDAEQAVDRVRIEIQRVAEHADAGIDHQHVQRPLCADRGDHRAAIGAVAVHRAATGLGGELLGGGFRAGIGEDDLRALAGEAPDDGRADAPAATQDQDPLVFETRHPTAPCWFV